jgi:hypothetical protein
VTSGKRFESEMSIDDLPGLPDPAQQAAGEVAQIEEALPVEIVTTAIDEGIEQYSFAF